MAKEDVIRMAREAGLWVPGFPIEHIERFAELVANDVLEAAAWEVEKFTFADKAAEAIRVMKESIK